MGYFILSIVGIIAFVIIFIKQINEYERGVMFTFGKYTSLKDPGWRIVIPFIQEIIKVDIRTRVADVPDQEAITRDNIPVKINAVVYYKIRSSEKAILQVENFYWAVSQMAQTTMRNIVGEVSLDDLLQKRADIAENIKKIVDEVTDPWGIDVQSVELKDVIIPENLKRTISKEAEAEREKKAVIIKSEGDKIAARNLSDAAQILNETPGGLHLRTLQSINDISSDKSNTTIWMLPVEALEALKKLSKK
jgi:regulator of protease activity HflC (stomatin/prohibitin superfamily)